MKKYTTKNNHWVSRFHTKPWEHEYRNLHFFDFNTNKLGRSSSENFFAKKRINSQDFEDWLNTHVETNGPKLIKTISKNESISQKDMDALALFLTTQLLRLSAKDNIDSYRKNTEALMSLSEKEILGVIEDFHKDYDLVPFKSPSDLFFNNFALFSIPYSNDQNKLANAHGLPLDLKTMIVMVKKGDRKFLIESLDLAKKDRPEYFSCLSVGSQSFQVCYSKTQDEKNMESIIKKLREEYIKNIQNIKIECLVKEKISSVLKKHKGVNINIAEMEETGPDIICLKCEKPIIGSRRHYGICEICSPTIP